MVWVRWVLLLRDKIQFFDVGLGGSLGFIGPELRPPARNAAAMHLF